MIKIYYTLPDGRIRLTQEDPLFDHEGKEDVFLSQDAFEKLKSLMPGFMFIEPITEE